MSGASSPQGDTADAAPLPVTGWAVLGILSFESELSGYDIKRWAEQSIAFFFWTPSFSQIYSELRRLESLGLAESRLDPRGETRNRRLYTITAEGTRRIREWAGADRAEPTVLKHAVMLRLWAGHNTTPAHLRTDIERYRAEAAALAERAAGHATGAEAVDGWAYPALALRWAERYYRDEAARMAWLDDELAAHAARQEKKEHS